MIVCALYINKSASVDQGYGVASEARPCGGDSRMHAAPLEDGSDVHSGHSTSGRGSTGRGACRGLVHTSGSMGASLLGCN